MASPPYRLLLANTVTGQVVADLPIGQQSPTWERKINGAGSLSATIPLSPRLDSDTFEMLTEPWRWTLVFAYGGAICQAGILTGLDIDDSQQPPTAQLHTTTMWDVLSKKRLVLYAGHQLTDPVSDVVFSATSPDPANINLSWGSVAARLVQITIGNSLNQYTPPIVLPAPTSGSATITYIASDLAYVGQRITEITQQDQGPEIEFSPEWVDLDHGYIQWRMRVGNPRLGNLGYPHAWDYQQACQYIKVSLDGASMTMGSYAKGQDNRSTAGGTLTWATAYDTTYIYSGWPWLEIANTAHSSETNQSVIQAYATSDVNTLEVPLYTGSATVRVDGKSITGQPTGSPSIEAVNVGDTCVLQVQNHLWIPDGQYGARILTIGNGSDQWTAKLDLQLLGAVTS